MLNRVETPNPGGLSAQGSEVRLEQHGEGKETPQRAEDTESQQHGEDAQSPQRGEGGELSQHDKSDEPPQCGEDQEPQQRGEDQESPRCEGGNHSLQEERGGEEGEGMRALCLCLPESIFTPTTSSGLSQPMAEDPHPSPIPPRSPAQVSHTVPPSDHTSSRITTEAPRTRCRQRCQ